MAFVSGCFITHNDKIGYSFRHFKDHIYLIKNIVQVWFVALVQIYCSYFLKGEEHHKYVKNLVKNYLLERGGGTSAHVSTAKIYNKVRISIYLLVTVRLCLLGTFQFF